MPAGRAHRKLATALIALGVIIGILAIHAVWANRQALETDTWTKTSSKLLEDHDIQEAVSGFLVDELYSNVDVQAQLAERLPPQAAILAGPAASGLRELADRIALEALQRPKIQALWEDANRVAHEKLLAIVEDKSDVLQLEGDTATLDLTALLGQISERVGIGQKLVDKLPAGAAQIEILRNDQIGLAQDGVRILRGLALVLSLLALGLFALAIHLARGWRRIAARRVGIGFILIGFTALVVRSLGGNAVVGALASTSAVEPAVRSTWEIGTSLLRASALSMIAYGILIILGSWLAGPGSVASELRRGFTPYLRERMAAYAGIAVIVLLVLWWNPTPGTGRVLPMVALIIILIAGVEALRAQGMRDFPDSQRGDLRTAAREALAARRGEGAGGGGAATTDAERLRQLERLADLRRTGVLSDEELAREKTRILGTA
jgi:hypothetical protein